MAFDWVRMKTEYMTNKTVTGEMLAKKYGVDEKYFINKISEEKWRDERNEIWQKAGEKMVQRLPDSIADVKLRHVRIARIMQSKVLDKIKGDNVVSRSTYTDLKTAVDIERDALGLNDKKAQEEDAQKLQQFNFIFSLKPDELRRFVESALKRATTPSSSSSNGLPEQSGERTGDLVVEATEISG